MGIKLMVEVLDHWQDAGLTAGERADLLVIAENANDTNRETFPKGGMHQDYVLKRVGKTAAAWKNAIGKLMKKGVISYAVRDGRELCGFPGQVAVYQITVMCPEAPHDGLHGQCTRPERVTSQVTQSESSDAMGHLSDDPNLGMGHLSDVERVTSQVTPSPPCPSPTSPSTPGGGGGPTPDRLQEAITFLENLPGRWAPGRATAQRLAPVLVEAVERQGWDLDQQLAAKLTEDLGPVKTYTGALKYRIEDLPKKPTEHTAAKQATLRAVLPPCACCGQQKPAATTHNQRPYCGGCTTPCTGCQQLVPTDQLHLGQCLTCLPIEQRTRAA